MNIHEAEAVLQPVAAFVYCNRQAAAGRRRQARDGNFHAPAGACATDLFYDGTTREIKQFYDDRPTAAARV